MIGYVVSEAEAVYHETNAGYTTQMKFHIYLVCCLHSSFCMKPIDSQPCGQNKRPVTSTGFKNCYRCKSANGSERHTGRARHGISREGLNEPPNQGIRPRPSARVCHTWGLAHRTILTDRQVADSTGGVRAPTQRRQMLGVRRELLQPHLF